MKKNSFIWFCWHCSHKHLYNKPFQFKMPHHYKLDLRCCKCNTYNRLIWNLDVIGVNKNEQEKNV